MSTAPRPIEPAAGDRGPERVEGPGVARRRDDVRVGEQHHRRTAAAARDPSDEVEALRIGTDELALDAGGLEVLRDQPRGRGLVAGRVGGVEADQGLRELDHLVAQRRPSSRPDHRAERATMPSEERRARRRARPSRSPPPARSLWIAVALTGAAGDQRVDDRGHDRHREPGHADHDRQRHARGRARPSRPALPSASRPRRAPSRGRTRARRPAAGGCRRRRRCRTRSAAARRRRAASTPPSAAGCRTARRAGPRAGRRSPSSPTPPGRPRPPRSGVRSRACCR